MLGLVAIALGVAVTTPHALLIFGAVLALTLLVAIINNFAKDPVGVFLWVWAFEIFQTPLAAVVGYNTNAGAEVRRVTDILIVVLLLLGLQRAVSKKQNLRSLYFILPGLGIGIIGVASTLVHPGSLSVAITGLWLGLKIWIVLGIALLLPWRTTDYERVYRWFMVVGVVVALLGVLDFVDSGIVSSTLHTNIDPTPGGGYRATSVHSIFVHPGEFSLFMSILVAIAGASYASRQRRKDLVFLLIFAGVGALSLRLKGALSLAVVFLVIALLREPNTRSSLGKILLLAALVGVCVYSFEGDVINKQFQTYASTESTARAQLYAVSEKIAEDDFPLGVGFGRFGSFPSRSNYSSVYDNYGLSHIYGLSRPFPQFIDDTSWPSVLGETGLFGLLIYVAGLIALAIACFRRLRKATGGLGWLPLSGLCVLAVVLVDSIGAPTLFDWIAAISFAIIMGPVLGAMSASGHRVVGT